SRRARPVLLRESIPAGCRRKTAPQNHNKGRARFSRGPINENKTVPDLWGRRAPGLAFTGGGGAAAGRITHHLAVGELDRQELAAGVSVPQRVDGDFDLHARRAGLWKPALPRH